MKSQNQKRNQGVSSVNQGPSHKIVLTIILLSYGILPLITPRFGAWDSNATKFLVLSVLNLVSYVYLYRCREIRSHFPVFSKSWIGFIYTLFIIVQLISVSKSLSTGESLITLSKYLTGFFAAFNISLIFFIRKDLMFTLCYAITLLLIFDCITVFFNLVAYINGSIESIGDITSIYSNKNILASAIFVKIPFSLWLITFYSGKERLIGFIALLFAVVSILFLSTRSFYIGILILGIAYFCFQIIKMIRAGERKKLVSLIIFVAVLIAGFFIYSIVQEKVFSKLKQDRYTVDVATRIGTIKNELSGVRMKEWSRTINLIQENPLLGVGPGNWKMQILKYENPETENFVFFHFNHNDFLQITAESGIIGGLLFLTLFILAGFYFIVSFFRKGINQERWKFLFIPAFGLLAYSVDAFFNFPCDRPEMVSLFAIFIGAVISQSPSIPGFDHTSSTISRLVLAINKLHSSRIIPVLIISVMILGIIIQFINYQSLKFQMVVVQDLLNEKQKLTYEDVEEGFPPFPLINAVDEPIEVIKARYLIYEERYNEAIAILKNFRTSPYYAKHEFFLGMAYEKSGNIDNALKHYLIAFQQKPLYFDFLFSAANIYERQGRIEKAIWMVEDYLQKKKKDALSWGYAAGLYSKTGNLEKAIMIVDSGIKYRPNVADLYKQKESLERQIKIRPFESIYNQALSAWERKDYPEAVKYFSEFIARQPGLPEAFEYRSSCFYLMNQFQNCINDINIVINSGVEKASLFNMRGAAYLQTGDSLKSCEDFLRAKELGDTTAAENLRVYCQGKNM